MAAYVLDNVGSTKTATNEAHWSTFRCLQSLFPRLTMSGPDIVTDADGQTISEHDQTIYRIAFDVRNVSPSNALLAFNNIRLNSQLYLDRLSIDFGVRIVADSSMVLVFRPQISVRDEARKSRPSFADLLSLINRTDIAAAIPPTLLHSIRIDQMECKANVSSSGASDNESGSYTLELLTLSASVGNTPRQQISYYDGPTSVPRSRSFAPSVSFLSPGSGRLSVMKVVQSRLIQSCLFPTSLRPSKDAYSNHLLSVRCPSIDATRRSSRS